MSVIKDGRDRDAVKEGLFLRAFVAHDKRYGQRVSMVQRGKTTTSP